MKSTIVATAFSGFLLMMSIGAGRGWGTQFWPPEAGVLTLLACGGGK